MSDFKKGDRVKVTYEGTVNYVDSGGGVDVYREVDEMYLGTARPDRVNVEKIPDPLPTTPGSVVRLRSLNRNYMLGDDERWLRQDGCVVHDMGAPSAFDVLVDAGAGK